MKIALVHDYLNQYGGAERVLETLMHMFPDAPIFTLLYDKAATLGRFEGRVAKTSFLDVSYVRGRHRPFIPLMPLAANLMNLRDDFDLIISDTAGYAKGVRYGKKTKHISYCHTPLRYAWENRQYVTMKVGSGRVRGRAHLITAPVAAYLRVWDAREGNRPDLMLANSKFIASKINNYYGRVAEVVYPPVDMSKFFFDPNATGLESKTGNYYLAVGRLLHYKRFDLIIDAFARVSSRLRIVGDGPEKKSLKNKIERLGARHITIEPFLESEDGLRGLYGGAKALVFPHVEDFGLVAAEAQACGTPIIAYAAGGALEIVDDRKTGMFFHEQTPAGLTAALEQFEKLQFDRSQIAETAKRFRSEQFERGIKDAIKRVWQEKPESSSRLV